MSSFDDIFTAATKEREEQRESFIKESKENREKCYALAEEKVSDVAGDGRQFQAYLDTQVRFPMHTPNNVLLVMAQKPDATQIGDMNFWKSKHVFVKNEEKDSPILILEPGEKYTREDNTIGTYYNAKKNYDISQTTAKYRNNSTRTYDLDHLISAIAKQTPVSIEPVDELPNSNGALFDPESNTIKLRKGLENGTAIFQILTIEMSHAMLAQGRHDYDRNENSLTAFSSSYMLCKKYGVDTKAYNFEKMQAPFPDMESSDVKQELYVIKKVTNDLSQRLDRDLKHDKKPVEKSDGER